MSSHWESMQRAIKAGDSRSALAFWRSKQWPESDRAEAIRMLGAALVVAREVLP